MPSAAHRRSVRGRSRQRVRAGREEPSPQILCKRAQDAELRRRARGVCRRSVRLPRGGVRVAGGSTDGLELVGGGCVRACVRVQSTGSARALGAR